ncbi:MAG: PIN domain-containing protein [Nanoarchaeota archaeon]
MERKQVILDTNFLLVPEQNRIDIFSEIEGIMDAPYDLYIIETTLRELEKLQTRGKGSDKVAARIGHQLMERYGVKMLPAQKEHGRLVDDQIVGRAKADPKSTIVCTNDKELKKRVLDEGASIIEVMQKKYLRRRG